MRKIIFLIFFSCAAFAEDFKFSPTANLQMSSQYSPFGTSHNRNIHFLDLRAAARLSQTRAYQFQFTGLAHYDPWNKSKSEQYWFDAPEAYFQWKPDALFRLQAGWNTFRWGVTDGFNPLDVVNARRYANPLSAEKLGAFSLALNSSFGDSVAELIYIPIQRKSILPGAESRWLPREFLQNQSINGTYFLIPSNLNYYFKEDQELNHALKNNFGLRFSTHFPDLDLSFIAFDGAAPTPTTNLSLSGSVVELLPNLVIQADPKIGIKPVYHRQSTAGASLTYALADFIFRFEGAYTKPHIKRGDLPGESQEYVAGLEHSISKDSHKVIVIGELSYAKHADAASNLITSLSRMFDRSVMLAARYTYGESFSLLGNIIIDTKYHSQLLRLEATEALSDSWKLSGTVESFSGPLGSPIGTYRNNDRAQLSLKFFL